MLVFVLASLAVAGVGVYGWIKDEPVSVKKSEDIRVCNLAQPVLFQDNVPIAAGQPGLVCPEATPAPKKKHLKSGGTGTHKLP